MPYRTMWVEPDVFDEHNGVTVYHTYPDDETENGPSFYWYTINPEAHYEDDLDEGVFDVRDLAKYGRLHVYNLDIEEGRMYLIRDLIERGILGADKKIHLPAKERAEAQEENN